jgi:hypothetical protein
MFFAGHPEADPGVAQNQAARLEVDQGSALKVTLVR